MALNEPIRDDPREVTSLSMNHRESPSDEPSSISISPRKTNAKILAWAYSYLHKLLILMCIVDIISYSARKPTWVDVLLAQIDDHFGKLYPYV